MNKGKHFILKDGVEIKEIKQTMFSNGDGFAYSDERSAEYAVARGTICSCGELIESMTYTVCPTCREKTYLDKYNKLPLVEWDNETPLTTFRGDKFFFDEDEIEDYCEEEDILKENLQLVLCEANLAPYFDLNEYCCDLLPEDADIATYKAENSKYSAKEVEKIVNDFLSSISPISWTEGRKRVSLT